MRPRKVELLLVVLACSAILSTCGGGGSPTQPDIPTVPIPTGAQVVRFFFADRCPALEDVRLLPILYTRVTITRSGTEWIGRAASPEGGDVELRFHLSGRTGLATSVPIEGTIKGIAIDDAGLITAIEPLNTRGNFGSDGRTTISGFAFAASALVPVAGVSGIGAGTMTVGDKAGHSCAQTRFSWGFGQ